MSLHGITQRHANTIATTTTTIGAKTPKAIAAAHARLTAQLAAAGSLAAPDGALHDAVAAAVDAGRDICTDPAVIDAVIREHVVAARSGLIARAVDTYAREVAPLVDQLVAAWAPAFDTAVATLTAAHEVLGDIDLGDTDTVVRLGPAGASAWADARHAVDTVDTIRSGLDAAAELSGRRPTAAASTARVAILTDDQRDQLGPKRPATWDLVRVGAVLSLATNHEVAERTAPAPAADAATKINTRRASV